MSNITLDTKLELIVFLPEKPIIDPSDLLLIQTSSQSYKITVDSLTAGIVDNQTLIAVNGKINVRQNGLALNRITQIAGRRVLGNVATGNANVSQIPILDDLINIEGNDNALASHKSIKDYVENRVVDSIPMGSVMAFTSNSVPAGWLHCNGDIIPVSGTIQGVSASVLQPLRTFLGNRFGSQGQLPDLRGEFIRGWDGNRGVDAGRVFGSRQTDELKSHTHTTVGRYMSIDGGVWVGGYGGGGQYPYRSDINPTGGNETRPRNVALLYCIKFTPASSQLTPPQTTFTGSIGFGYYESGEVTLPSNNSTRTVNHGLGQAPKWTQVELVCKEAEGGWNAGERVIVSDKDVNGVGAYSIFVTDSQIGFTTTSAIRISRKNDGSTGFTIDKSKWRLVFRASMNELVGVSRDIEFVVPTSGNIPLEHHAQKNATYEYTISEFQGVVTNTIRAAYVAIEFNELRLTTWGAWVRVFATYPDGEERVILGGIAEPFVWQGNALVARVPIANNQEKFKLRFATDTNIGTATIKIIGFDCNISSVEKNNGVFLWNTSAIQRNGNNNSVARVNGYDMNFQGNNDYSHLYQAPYDMYITKAVINADDDHTFRSDRPTQWTVRIFKHENPNFNVDWRTHAYNDSLEDVQLYEKVSDTFRPTTTVRSHVTTVDFTTDPIPVRKGEVIAMRLRIKNPDTDGNVATASNEHNVHLYGFAKEGQNVLKTFFQDSTDLTPAPPVYGCRAWVNFDGTNVTNVGGEDHCHIRGSGNISKVVRTATGQYTIHFAVPMLDANYTANVTSTNTTENVDNLFNNRSEIIIRNNVGNTTNSELVTVAVFR